MTAVDVVSLLGGRFPRVSPRASADFPAINVPSEDLLAAMRVLRDECGYDLLTDVSGVDWGVDAEPRFGVFYHLHSIAGNAYLRVATSCSVGEPPTVPSMVSLWPSADWHERETYDFFGIRFEGHPDLRRILMWDGYPHFPLRKEFPLAGVETVLPDEEVAAETGVKVQPAPMAGGPFVAPQEDTVREREPRAKDESWNERRPKPEN
jgi:NADH-quinone oxidoreductase subunit C